VTWPELVDVWQLADRTGFDTAWTFDHFFPIMSDPTGPQFEGWIALTALAMKTERVRVGTLVTGITYRHPAVLANMGASLDVISGGRLEMGLGAAWFEGEHQALGIEFPPTGERIRRLDEACEIIKRLWTQPVTDFDGRYYHLRQAYCEPKPVQKPRPPIMIGGGGEQLTLRVVAKHADEWNLFGSPGEFRRKTAILEEHCRAVGRDPASIEKSVAAPLALTLDPARADQLVADIAARRQADPEELKASMLWGTPDEIIRQVEAYRDAGVSHIILSLRPPYDLSQLERFATEVIPAVREPVSV
jgi:F420-dependent oxidoreductase-like protein